MDAPLSVSQFNRMVKQLVECDRLSDIIIVGELKEYRPASSGHVYPVLTDGTSVINCSLFRNVVSRLNFQPKVGMKVEAFGSASYYEPSGKFSFNIRGMKPAGEGDEKRKLEELKLRLMEEGLFDRKRPLPRYPVTIGVVTSRTGAVIKDIVDTARKRFPANILLVSAKVQGDGAPESIVEGIRSLNSHGVDIIIVGRGGGSADDLKAFNTEMVARAMFESPAPTISAVGHATDKSITDLVADRYAETPTAAAMLATADLDAERDRIESLDRRIRDSMRTSMSVRDRELKLSSSRLESRSPVSVLKMQSANLKVVSERADDVIMNILTSCKHSSDIMDMRFDLRRLADYVIASSAKVDDLSESMDSAMNMVTERFGNRLENISARLESLDPERVLHRGYSYITDGTGRTVTSVGSLTEGSEILVRMRDGRAVAAVKDVIRNG